MLLDLVMVSHSMEGHRKAYVDQFRQLFADQAKSTGIASSWQAAVFEPAPVLFLMVEESFFGYVISALLRTLMGRRTAGLLFRGREAALGRAPRLILKRSALKLIKHLRAVTTISIVPFTACAKLSEVADSWIEDPQLWDLTDLSKTTTPLSTLLLETAGGRKLLVSIGAQNRGKGFCYLSDLYRADTNLQDQWLVVAAGKVGADAETSSEELAAAGGLVIDRFISDIELQSLYGVADVIWGVYSPDYDQASGIFGRAVQYDVPILVREGSAVDIQARLLGIRAISIGFGRLDGVIDLLSSVTAQPKLMASPVPLMRARSLKVLNSAIWERV